MRKIKVRLSVFLSVLSCCSIWAGPALDFEKAQEAYNKGEFYKAIEFYNHLKESNNSHLNLDYNLGNSYFKSGNSGQAMLSYQRALKESPNDPDILANINHLIKQTGAGSIKPNAIVKSVSILNPKQWILLSTVIFWTFCILLTFSFLFPQFNFNRSKITWVSLSFLIGSIFLSSIRIREYNSVKAVILDKDAKVFFAPLDNSTLHFTLPLANVVHVKEVQGSWLKIQHGKEAGWVKKEQCAMVN